ncbi:hypothetical protein VPH35_108931 [Triticum aestivum]
MAHPHTVRRCVAPIPAQLPIPPASEPFYRLAAPSRASYSPPHHSLLSDEIRGAAPSRGRARSLGGGIDRATPPAPRPPLRRRHAGRNLLVATPGNWRAPCSARRPCSKPCSPRWAEIEQEWIPWCTTNLALSRSAPLSPSAFSIGSFVGLATPVKFDLGGASLTKYRTSKCHGRNAHGF